MSGVGASVGAGDGFGVGAGDGAEVGRTTHADCPVRPLVYMPTPQAVHDVRPKSAPYVSTAHGVHLATVTLFSPAYALSLELK